MKQKILIGFTIGLLLVSASFLSQHLRRKDISETLVTSSESSKIIIPGIIGRTKKPVYSNLTPEEQRKFKERQSFLVYLESSYLRLPTISSLKLSKDGDFHHVPINVIESSEVFGEIADKIKTNPSLIKEALRFYGACALNEQVVTSIRAVCARNLKDWARKTNTDISRVILPENIERVSEVLPNRN